MSAFVKVNEVFRGYRIPTQEEMQGIQRQLQTRTNSNMIMAFVLVPVFAVAAFAMFQCMRLAGADIAGVIFMGIVGIAIIAAAIFFPIALRRENKELKQFTYKQSEISVIDCVCIDVQIHFDANAMAGPPEEKYYAKVQTLSGQICDHYFPIDYQTAKQGAVGQQMLLVRFSTDGFLLLTNTMLNSKVFA